MGNNFYQKQLMEMGPKHFALLSAQTLREKYQFFLYSEPKLLEMAISLNMNESYKAVINQLLS